MIYKWVGKKELLVVLTIEIMMTRCSCKWNSRLHVCFSRDNTISLTLQIYFFYRPLTG